MLWYKEHLPQVYEKAEKVLQSNGYLAFRLTGAVTQDKSQGYGWACYNVARNQWDIPLCQELGVKPSLLPEIVSCSQVVGGVTPQAAQETGLLEGTPVVAGGLDAACGTLGAGVIHPGETQEQGGQAGGMSLCVDSAQADPRLILSAHVVEGLWLLQGGTVGGGGALNWFEREFAAAERAAAQEQGGSSFQQLDREAEAVPPGCQGLVFLPYLAGERSPLWDIHAKGVYYGIDFSKTRAHFARACMEGVAYSLRHNLEVAQEAGASAGTLRAHGRRRQQPPVDPDKGGHHRQGHPGARLGRRHLPGRGPFGWGGRGRLPGLRPGGGRHGARHPGAHPQPRTPASLRTGLPAVPAALRGFKRYHA